MQPVAITTQYVMRERGPMTTLGGVEGLAFVHTKYSNRSDHWPDIQFHFAPASINSDDGVRVRKILGITERVYDAVYRPIANRDTWTLLPLLLRPRSRGKSGCGMRCGDNSHVPEKKCQNKSGKKGQKRVGNL